MNFLDNTTKQPSKCRTKNLVKINDESPGTYSTKSQIKSKTTMLKLSLCDCSNVYIVLREL